MAASARFWRTRAPALMVAALALSAVLASASAQGYPSNRTAAQSAALAAFERDYGLFGGAPSLSVSYGIYLDAGIYGVLLSMFSPRLVLYKLGGDAEANLTVNLFFQTYSASFYEVNGTTVYCLGSSTWFSSSVSRCGLVGNITGHGMTVASLNLSSRDFANVSYLGASGAGGSQCDEFSGTYTGGLLQGLFSRAGLQSGNTTEFDFCMNRQYGYIQQLNASLPGYSLELEADNASTAPLPASQFAMPVSFVADWAACSGSSLGFYYVPGSGVSNPAITVSAQSGAPLASRTLPGRYGAYGMYYLNFTSSQPLYGGENLSVCSGGSCVTLQCT